jgi:5-(carboxyamino)imidazole ribonucleotide mutase
MSEPLVGVIMGSRSDWETMRHAVETLESLGVPFETRVVSAHRTPDLLFETRRPPPTGAQDRGRGGRRRPSGMTAAKTHLPCSASRGAPRP